MSLKFDQDQELLAHIQKIITSHQCPDDIRTIKEYIKILKKESEFYPASKLLNQARDKQQKLRQSQGNTAEEWWQAETAKDEVWIVQQLALCTYKNEEIPARKRLEQALALLEEIGLRNPSNKNTETLCLGGAAHKIKWQQFGQTEDLYESLSFYRAAFERNPQQDMGYGGVNAAFIMDILADRASRIAHRSNTSSEEARRLKEKADTLRQQIIATVPAWLEQDQSIIEEYRFWHLLTLAEAHFGLKEYHEAGEWLNKADVANADNWKRWTVFMQLRQLAYLQDIVPPKEADNPVNWDPAWKALAIIVGEKNAQRALTSGSGKVGLALSGGGFRASFFHLGVLARLAEMDALRNVEALSTVSGGSILGAHYYLEVQNLLQTKADNEITCDDYIAIVRRVQEKFLKGVQTNVKMQTFASIKDNWEFISGKNDYSRSHRLGEFYESKLYQEVADGHAEDKPRSMPELLIKPKDASDSAPFKPKFSNWIRRAKVPTLILNSSSLSSGHNWQFTANSMGEPPSHINGEIDINRRYRRVYYPDAPTDELKHYRLGYAVAASACVPGMFEPLTITGLYEDRTVRLVDGGVHDNQGVAGLLSEGCTRILCSDACGQMEDIKSPSDTPPGVLLRVTSILQDRVREAEYQDLRCRLDSRALDGLFFVHTRKELEAQPLDWINCQDPQPSKPISSNQTSYGIDRELQEKIAGMRTDLDAFTEVEAYALIASGYRITKREFELLQEQHLKDGKPDTWGGYDIDAAGVDWPFRKLEPLLAMQQDTNQQSKDLHHQLHVARKVFFKVWDLSPVYRVLMYGVGIVALLLLGSLIISTWSAPAIQTITWGALIIFLLLTIASFFVPMFRWLNPGNEAKSILLKFAIATIGYTLARFHIHCVDRYFLARGKLERLLNLKQ
ncbi:tetratricopeptide repeat-containing protein [Nitrosomonas sp.]|uniref:tetratricopeptide repeat-containing protein n=1 Tax=Nitrosomonas sp. TaxID=42353 RepID=UPI00260ED1E4|nr:tetratricopeptide repeat-containing protein [Nitrosomonas sp.]